MSVRAIPASKEGFSIRALPALQSDLLGEAVDHGPIAVFVADEDMRYVAVNAAACKLVGYSRAELMSMRVTDVAANPVAPHLYSEMVRVGFAAGVTPLRKKDGGEVLFSYMAGETRIAGITFYISYGISVGA